jgi:hypothetical protein
MIEDQPAPVATHRRPAWDIVLEHMARPREDAYGEVRAHVIADMKQRDELGRARYGTPLTSHNGRDHLVDAYQEALDMAVYLAAWLDERGFAPHDFILTKEPGGWTAFCIQNMFYEHIRAIVRLRALIDDLAQVSQ